MSKKVRLDVLDLDLADTIRRIAKSAKRDQGTRLTSLECKLIVQEFAAIYEFQDLEQV